MTRIDKQHIYRIAVANCCGCEIKNGLLPCERNLACGNPAISCDDPFVQDMYDDLLENDVAPL